MSNITFFVINLLNVIICVRKYTILIYCLFNNIVIIQFLFLVFNLPDPLYCTNKCGRCYKGMGRKGSLNYHLRYECGVPRQFQCSQCPKKFARKYDLKTHCVRIHKIILT